MVHRVMIVLAVVGDANVMADLVRSVLGVRCAGRCQLKGSALTPRCRAGDKSEREGQRQGVVKHATHRKMLAASGTDRQHIFSSGYATASLRSAAR